MGGGGRGRGEIQPASVHVPAPPPPWTLARAAPHARPARDHYAITFLADAASLAYAALFFQAAARGASSIADISGSHALPPAYLAVLFVLFLLTVADRVVYSVGSCAGKVRRRGTRVGVGTG